MKFEHKGVQYTFPALLSEITLGRRIAFYEEHGKTMDERAEVLRLAKEQCTMDDFELENELIQWHMELAVRTFSFFTGIELEELQTSVAIADVMSIYDIDMQLLMEQEQDITLQQCYMWNDEAWVISPPELKADNDMTFNEFLHSKEIIRQLAAVGKGKWDALPYLCAIYLRKENEPFSEALVAEGSERMKLMLELPLDIALAVGFFLSSTLHIYTSISASSTKGNPKESTHQATSTAGDGNHSSAT